LKLVSPDPAVNAYTLLKITKTGKRSFLKIKTKQTYVTSVICLVLLKTQTSLRCLLILEY